MHKKKVFVIDDDLTFLKFLKILFEKENYQVITDRNAYDICHKIKQSRPDIILLDLLMPNNSGFQIFKKMKKDDFCSKIPVVVLTSHQNLTSKIQLLREGVLDYIYKPFRKEELLLRMKNYIQFCTNQKSQPFNEDLLFNQLKEILSARNKKWIEPQLDKKSLYGYVYQDIRLVSEIPIYGKERDLLEEWAERKLLDRSLIDIVELCPLCYHYNVSLNYICPICGSINIEQRKPENNSPRSFKCNDCGMYIKVPQIRYHCINCDEKFEREKIVKQKIYRYQFMNSDATDKKEEQKPVIKSVDQESKEPNQYLESSTQSGSRVYYGNTNFVYAVLKETNVPYVLPKSFTDRIIKEIRYSEIENSDITVMSIGIENLYRLTLKLKSETIKKLFKGILYTIVKHIRPKDVLSFNSEQHRYLIMLPNTHIKMAKIIAERIQQKLDRFQTTFPLEINLASYPQDGRTVEEIFTMLEIGLEKVASKAFA
jgi:FixJ family two-component response regulator